MRDVKKAVVQWVLILASGISMMLCFRNAIIAYTEAAYTVVAGSLIIALVIAVVVTYLQYFLYRTPGLRIVLLYPAVVVLLSALVLSLWYKQVCRTVTQENGITKESVLHGYPWYSSEYWTETSDCVWSDKR